MKNVIFIAPPAAGKGTLSKFLETKYSYQHISTGDLFREKILMQDEESKELKQILESGQLVDDKILFHLLEEKLKSMNTSKNFVLDGIPRTLQQAKYLDIILRDLGFSDYVVINIIVDEETLLKRITGRRNCLKCKRTYNIYFEKFKPHKELTCDLCSSPLIQRADDSINSFKVRYEIFQKNSQPIIDYYQVQNRIFEIDNTMEDHGKALKDLERIVGALID